MEENFKEELNEPVSPMGQCLDNTSLCLYILAFLEFQVPIHDLPIFSLVEDAFLSIPRFTSIMVLPSTLSNTCKNFMK